MTRPILIGAAVLVAGAGAWYWWRNRKIAAAQTAELARREAARAYLARIKSNPLFAAAEPPARIIQAQLAAQTPGMRENITAAFSALKGSAQ